jgi:adenosylcobinamide-GDP ribazoletransferase
MNQIKLFLIALQFYTRIPIVGNLATWANYSPQRLSSSTRYFTVVGILIGAVCATSFFLAQQILPHALAVVIAIAAGILATGGFHEDGWADFCDGFGGVTSKQRTLDIMTDSRIGSYAGLGLIVLLLAKFAALNAMSPQLATCALLIAHPLSRGFAVLIMATLPYAKPLDDAKAKPIAQGLAGKDLFIALSVCVLFCGGIFLMGFATLGSKQIGLALLFMFAGWWRIRYLMKSRLQGYTGDTLGATQQLTECLAYVGLAAM